MEKYSQLINLILSLVLFAIINYKLLKLVKYEEKISKLSGGIRAVLSIVFLAIGYYLIIVRFDFSSSMGIHVSIILYVSMLFIALGTKTYKLKQKR